nr:MAG TPA: hypothetical protein [Caudoviricetes sp.]
MTIARTFLNFIELFYTILNFFKILLRVKNDGIV